MPTTAYYWIGGLLLFVLMAVFLYPHIRLAAVLYTFRDCKQCDITPRPALLPETVSDTFVTVTHDGYTLAVPPSNQTPTKEAGTMEISWNEDKTLFVQTGINMSPLQGETDIQVLYAKYLNTTRQDMNYFAPLEEKTRVVQTLLSKNKAIQNYSDILKYSNQIMVAYLFVSEKTDRESVVTVDILFTPKSTGQDVALGDTYTLLFKGFSIDEIEMVLASTQTRLTQ
jgi:hypothetical protein